MNKGLIAIIVVLIVALGTYGSYYAYTMTYLVPKDVKVLKDELKSINESGSYDKDIAEIEKLANQVENEPSLKYIPLSERQKDAKELQNNLGMQSINGTLSEIKQNVTYNEEMASKYNSLLRGDITNDIKFAYSEEIVNTLNSMNPLMTKLDRDLTKGDNKAVANDLRKIANILRNFSKQEQISANNLQDVVNKLETKKRWIFF